MPNPTFEGERAIGGPSTHRNPKCPCIACRARRRKKEAIAGGTGDQGAALEIQAEKVEKVAERFRKVRGKSKADRIAQWMAFRAVEPGITNKEIAARLGISYSHLTTLLYKAGKQGLLKDEDTLSRLRHEIIPKAMDNLSEFLDKKDRTATLETMKGTAFPSFREAEGVSEAPRTVLALKIETVSPDQVKIVSGHIVGKAKEIEGA